MKALVGIALFLAPAVARADEPTRAVELGLSFGLARQVAPKVDASHELSSFNGGIAVGGQVLLRTTYFLSGFLDAGYVQLYASREERDVGPPFGTLTSQSSLRALSLIGGPAIDIGPVRVQAGIGAYELLVRSTVLGRTITPTEIDLGYLITAGATLWRSAPFCAGIEGRVLLIAEAQTAAVSLGATFGWDAAQW